MDEEQLARLQSLIENRIKRGFRTFVREIKDDNTLGEIEAAIKNGDFEALLDGVADAAEKLAIEINTGYVQAGQKASRQIDAAIDAKATFNVAADEAIEWMTDQADTLIQAMVAEQNEVARKVVADGRARGWSDSEIADEVRSSIGLNVQQVDYISSYRDALEGGNYQNAIDRALADDRYDKPLEAALDNDTEINGARIDGMVDKYRDNWLDQREDFVANMEGQSAMGAGIDEAMQQSVEAGDITPASIVRTWHTRHDPKVRTSHRTMDGQQRGLDDLFMSGNGVQLRYPGDEEVDASETANCRCVMTFDIDVSVLKGFFRRVEADHELIALVA